MRVLIVNKFARVTGGADRHALDVAQLLRARGHEVRFVSTEFADNAESEGTFVPCSVTHDSRDRLGAVAAARVAGAALWSPAAAAATRAEIERFRPHVVHAHKLYPQLSVAPVEVARRRGVAVVQTLHDYEFVSASPTDAAARWYDATESRAAYRTLNTATFAIRRTVHRRAVSAWIAVSEFVASVHRAHGIAARVIPNFTAQVEDAPRAGFEERAGVVYVGRLTKEKGIDDVIRLAKNAPQLDVTVLGGGEGAGRLRHAAAALPNLVAAGAVPPEQAAAAMRTARIVVMPSRWEEPGPLVAVEAMASGTPIVAYGAGGLGEYVNRASAGAVVPPSVERLVEACVRLHDDRAEWEARSAAGPRAVAGTHSPAAYAAALEEVYGCLAC